MAGLLRDRGQDRLSRSDYEGAIADFEAAIEAGIAGASAHLRLASARLALGRTEAAAASFSKAVEVHRAEPDAAALTLGLYENLEALFEHAAPASFSSYLKAVLDTLDAAGEIERFDEALSLTVFALLKKAAAIGEQRFEHIIPALAEAAGDQRDVSVASRILRTGVDYFLRNDSKALLRLPREARNLFCRELGIKEPGTTRRARRSRVRA